MYNRMETKNIKQDIMPLASHFLQSKKIIANAPNHQLARKAYFWKKVNELREQKGMPKQTGYRASNAKNLEAEYTQLLFSQGEQNRKHSLQSDNRKEIKPKVKKEFEISQEIRKEKAQKKIKEILYKRAEFDISRFFQFPKPNREIEITNIPLRDVISLIKLDSDYTLLLNAGNNYWTVSNQNIDKIIELLKSEVIEISEAKGSDSEIINNINNPDIKVKFIWRRASRRKPNGGYFKYYNKLEKINLSRYGIYRNAAETDEYKLNCLEIALSSFAKIEMSKFDKLKSIIKTRYIPQKDLKIIAEHLQIYIVLSKIDTYNKLMYGDKNHTQIHIGLIDEHYFLIEKTNYTSYSIVNYFDVNDKENFNKIFAKEGTKYKRKEGRNINSFELVKLLIEHKATHLENITMANCGTFSQYSNRVSEYKDLPEVAANEVEYCREKKLCIPNIFIDIEATKAYKDLKKILPLSCNFLAEQEMCEEEFLTEQEDKIYHPYDVLYFDTEATTDGEIHKPYMICSETRGEQSGEKKYYKGKYCILKWLQSLERNYICIAHNLRYDFQFIVKYLSQAEDPVKTGNKIKSVSGKFYNKNTNKTILLHFKDSYGLISMPLKQFGKCFNLDVKKEIMPYEAFNSTTICQPKISIDYAASMLVNSEKEDFIKNIIEWNLFFPSSIAEQKEEVSYSSYDVRKSKMFDHIEYARKYCELDVDVLKKGYETFRKWMLEVTGLDIDNALSIPQLANTYGLNQGVFSGCYKISGVARDFIQKCVVGGRCMVRNNKAEHIKHNVDDFDGVSLYPSAMHRMEGLLMGQPKVITDEIKKQILNQLFSPSCEALSCEAKKKQQEEEKIDIEIKILQKLFSYNSNTKFKVRNPEAYMIASRTRTTGLNLIKMLPDYSQDEFDVLVNYKKRPLTIASFIKGMSKEDLKDWRNYIKSIKKPDGYFVEINVINVKKYRDFPLLSRVNASGVRVFSNDIRGSGIFVDKTSIEDLIKFQDIEFEIIRGYYFNEGRNTKIKTFIKELFDERLKKKSEKNPIQEVYKLIMNAFYGKLIMKPIEHNFSFIYGKDEFEKHLQYHFNSISQYTQITEGLHFVKKSRSIMDHFSMPHGGVEVLSMSKRIMNEVMCLAEDINIEIYYQDTDSMHIDSRPCVSTENGVCKVKTGVQKLSNEFTKVYGRELVGKYLGQFHSDFDYKSIVPPISVESIYLGKKSYIDKVRVENCSSSGEQFIDYMYHMRMKGIPGITLLDEVKKNYNGDAMEMYSKLLNHKPITFDLLKVCKFKCNNNFTTSNNKEFMRTVCF